MADETKDYRIKMSKKGYEALTALATKESRPVSTVIREAIETHLKSKGYDVSLAITWGGKRGDDK